ncbi:unnamed protein product [Calypogeia fissa]
MGSNSGATGGAPFPEISECSLERREDQTVISDLDGTLVRARNSFPYFMLIAFEAGSWLRSVIFLLLSPIAWVLYHFISESAGIKFIIFLTFAGLKMKRIETVCRAVLPKFYAEDMHQVSWRVFSSFGKRYILTANPRVMVEVFGKEYLGADEILGSEMQVTKGGYCTGFVKAPGILVGDNKVNAMLEKFGKNVPDVGMGDRETDWPFMSLCKEGYIVPTTKVADIAKDDLPKPIIFHDGRLVCRPTPLNALVVLLWMPIGFILAVVRIGVGCMVPMSTVIHVFRFLGVRVVVKGTPPAPVKESGKLGVLFVCSHRTLLDPIFLSVALRRPVCAVTYSISRVSEIISPIRTMALSRQREQDAANIRKLLAEGDLAICPEGTTCREPFLLRFSSLFAELTDQIVPVANYNRMSMFHGTTATGWKGMDPFFFFMNPSPVYEVNFLNKLPLELTCSGGKTSYEVANYIQRVLAGVLSFECTNLTRKDKYLVLAGNDGSVAPKKSPSFTLSSVSR